MEPQVFKHIAMLSTHGYFDPVPTLGITDTGGQVVYVLELSKALARKGIKVDIYTRWFDKSKPQIDPVPGIPDVRVIRIPCGDWEFVPKEFIYNLLPELSANMIRFISKNNLNYDLFHGHYVDAGIVMLDVAGYFEKPSYFTAHSLGAWKRDQMGGDAHEMEKKFNFKHRIAEEMRIFKGVRGQTMTSSVQLEKLNALYNFNSDNIEIIPPGVDIYRFRMLRASEQVTQTRLPDKYILNLSRIDSNKGHDLLLKAYARIVNECDDVHLVIGGGSTHPKPREIEIFDMMKKIISENRMTDKVHIVGYISDEMMLPFYQNAMLFVLPSIFEPFGMTTQEAMACGCPVIASKFGGIRNAITHGKNGLLIDPQNEKEFAGSLKMLINDEVLRKKIGKSGSVLIRNEYSWEAIADRFVEFYIKYI
ncbi:MAG: glycosyltransferase family 1 protein [Bacteroidetes bacterium]|nr:glycosyltransferase family 1 protein [Bacteroidota bacterium]